MYGFDDLTGSLQLSHKLVLSSKDYPGILVKYCQHFKWGLSVVLQCSVCEQETLLTMCFLSSQMSTHPYQQNIRENWQNTWRDNQGWICILSRESFLFSSRGSNNNFSWLVGHKAGWAVEVWATWLRYLLYLLHLIRVLTLGLKKKAITIIQP